jgi:hypothetical protein
MRKAVVLIVLAALETFGQVQAVNQAQGPTSNNYVTYLDIGSTPQYICEAQAVQPLTTFYVSSSTLTQIAVSSNVGTITFASTSYLWIGARITVAGSATTALNGTYSVTGVSGSTATIATSGVSNGTYNDSTLTVSTRAPLLNSLVWAIQVTQYSGANQIGQYWAGTPGPIPPMNLACSSRHNY